MPKQISEMTIEELEQRIDELAAQRHALRAEALACQARIDELRAAEKLEAMTDAERAALAQAITNAGGIQTLSKVGIPGAK